MLILEKISIILDTIPLLLNAKSSWFTVFKISILTKFWQVLSVGLRLEWVVIDTLRAGLRDGFVVEAIEKKDRILWLLIEEDTVD